MRIPKPESRSKYNGRLRKKHDELVLSLIQSMEKNHVHPDYFGFTNPYESSDNIVELLSWVDDFHFGDVSPDIVFLFDAGDCYAIKVCEIKVNLNKYTQNALSFQLEKVRDHIENNDKKKKDLFNELLDEEYTDKEISVEYFGFYLHSGIKRNNRYSTHDGRGSLKTIRPDWYYEKILEEAKK